MVLSFSEVVEIIEYGVQDKIKTARKNARHLNMHVTGKGLKNYLEKLDSYENEAQKLLREKLAKSNKGTFSFLLRPMDKIFTAKGGSVNYNLPQNQINKIKDSIADIADGLDIKTYLKKNVKKKYIIDPNGILFCDLNPDGMIETYTIMTDQILWYKNKGNHVEAIVFAPYKKDDDDDSLYYRVIDDETDRIFKAESGDEKSISVVSSETLDNFFGFVPARILGDIKDPNDDVFESIVSDIVDEADRLLRRMSVMNLHDLAHLYPRYWSLAQACTRCDGEGEIVKDPDSDPPETTTCPSCGGTGDKTRTNPSDEMVIKWPKEGDVTVNKYMGFESPDLQTAKHYEVVIEATRDQLFRDMWGTIYETGGKRETATGRYLDAQPVADRLQDISFTFSQMHKFLLDCYAKVILRQPAYESSVNYGTRYILEGPDDVLDKYIEVSKENVSDITRMDLKNRYLEAEYKDDPIELLKRKKLFKVEPFPTLSAEKVLDNNNIPEEMRDRKMYFPMWVNTLSDEKIVFASVDDLRESFNEYILILKSV